MSKNAPGGVRRATASPAQPNSRGGRMHTFEATLEQRTFLYNLTSAQYDVGDELRRLSLYVKQSLDELSLRRNNASRIQNATTQYTEALAKRNALLTAASFLHIPEEIIDAILNGEEVDVKAKSA